MKNHLYGSVHLSGPYPKSHCNAVNSLVRQGTALFGAIDKRCSLIYRTTLQIINYCILYVSKSAIIIDGCSVRTVRKNIIRGDPEI